jgi:hypothetical protein
LAVARKINARADSTPRVAHIAALWRLDVGLREKTFWKMLYESAARPKRCCA